jgi:hypothetical protein
LLLGALVACGGQAAGALLDDAGQLLRDAGAWLEGGVAAQDSGDQPAAGASVEVREVPCSAAYAWTETRAGETERVESLWAELDLDTSLIKGVTAIRCDAINDQLGGCSSGASCAGNVEPAASACEAGAGVEVGPSKLRTICGRGTNPTGGPVPPYFHYQRVRFVLVR